MLDKLVDLLVRFGMDMLPFVIVEQWNGAVQLRFGKFIKVLYPGIHFKIPFFDSIIECPVITQSVNLPSQTLTTLDDESIVLKSIIRYKVSNIQTYLLSVMHANDVLIDTTQGIIRDVVERIVHHTGRTSSWLYLSYRCSGCVRCSNDYKLHPCLQRSL